MPTGTLTMEFDPEKLSDQLVTLREAIENHENDEMDEGNMVLALHPMLADDLTNALSKAAVLVVEVGERGLAPVKRRVRKTKGGEFCVEEFDGDNWKPVDGRNTYRDSTPAYALLGKLYSKETQSNE